MTTPLEPSTFIVKVLKSGMPTYWYADLIGEQFECIEFADTYLLKKDYQQGEFVVWRHIQKSDCEIVKGNP